jgi:hypothetical protein
LPFSHDGSQEDANDGAKDETWDGIVLPSLADVDSRDVRSQHGLRPGVETDGVSRKRRNRPDQTIAARHREADTFTAAQACPNLVG